MFSGRVYAKEILNMEKRTLGYLLGLSLFWVSSVQARSDSMPILAECGGDHILNGSESAPGGKENPGSNSEPAKTGAWLENLLISSAWARAVTTEDRIQDCSKIAGSSKKPKGVEWNLVSRKRDLASGKFYEVWRDSKSKRLWGDRVVNPDHQEGTYSHHNAVAMLANGAFIAEKACISVEGKKANAGVSDKTFALPTIQEFEEARENGITNVLPNMKNRSFWSVSLEPKNANRAGYFNANDGYIGYESREYDFFSVLCVGREA